MGSPTKAQRMESRSKYMPHSSERERRRNETNLHMASVKQSRKEYFKALDNQLMLN